MLSFITTLAIWLISLVATAATRNTEGPGIQ